MMKSFDEETSPNEFTSSGESFWQIIRPESIPEQLRVSVSVGAKPANYPGPVKQVQSKLEMRSK